MPVQAKDFALVVGINDYPSYGIGGNNLRGAADDARAVAGWLTDRQDGGGLPARHCELIVSAADPLRPLKHEVDAALERLWNAAAEVPDPRRFYLYFSGHGHAERIDDVALCLANWSFRRRHAALSSGAYRRLIHHCMRFDQVVVILDCCRLRQHAAAGLRSELDCVLPDEQAGSSRFFIAYATEFQQAAFEDTDGGADGPVRGHMTLALLEGLRGAAPLQPGGGVAAHDLADYLRARVPEMAGPDQPRQQVEVVSSLPSNPPVLFGSRGLKAPDARQPAAGTTNCRILFSSGREGPIRLESPTLEVLREDSVSSGPWELHLEIGHHRIADLATGAEHFFVQRSLQGINDVSF